MSGSWGGVGLQRHSALPPVVALQYDVVSSSLGPASACLCFQHSDLYAEMRKLKGPDGRPVARDSVRSLRWKWLPGAPAGQGLLLTTPDGMRVLRAHRGPAPTCPPAGAGAPGS